MVLAETGYTVTGELLESMVTLCITHDRIGALRLGYKMARLLLNQVPNHTPYTNSCRPNATVANPTSCSKIYLGS